MTIRAITVRNYWAWGLVYGGKNPENRGTGALDWRHRGETLIHVGKDLDLALRNTLLLDAADDPTWARLHLPPHMTDPRRRSLRALRDAVAATRSPQALRALTVSGAVIGKANLVDIHRARARCCWPWGEQWYWTTDRTLRQGPAAHLVFEDVEPVWPPVDCRGALGLWAPPPEVLEELGAAA